MPRKLIEKLTGQAKLSQDQVREMADVSGSESRLGPIIKQRSEPLPELEPEEEIIEEEVDGDFELPPEDEIETIEEVIEDDSIDSEQVEEYYEVIDEEGDESEAEDGDGEDVEEEVSEDESDEAEEDEEEEEDETENEERHDYPSFDFHGESEEEEVRERKAEHKNAFEEFERELETAPVHPAPTPILAIDIYELHHELIIRALIPGITPDNLKVSITRTHVTLSGERTEPDGIDEEAYYSREIPAGAFHRVITLPVEVDVEHAEAVEKYGLLIIRLPKVDSKKSQELKVRSA